MQKLTTYRRNTGTYTPTQYEVEGVNYISVPVIMMTPGVRAGSRGPLLHTPEQLQANVEDWNGHPVVINHPKNEAGNYISAHTEGVEAVGTILNTRYENGLRADLQLNADVLQQNHPHVYASIIAAQPIEVSIGAFSQENNTPGTYEGTNYIGQTLSYNPDHLAILPNTRGACSTDAGCGIRVNEEQNNNQKEGNQPMKLKEKAAELHKEGFGVYNFQINESLLARLDAIRSLVDSWDSDYAVHWLRDVYEDSFVYEKRLRRNETTRRIKFYKQDYTLSENGEVELQGEPIEVIQKTEYLPIQANNKEQSNNKKGEEEMAQEKCCPQKVEELIVNVASKFTEKDRAFLSGLNAEQLELVTPKEVNITVNEDHVRKHLATYTEVDKVIELLPESMQVNVKAGIVLEEKNREELISAIQTNAKDVWEKEELESMQTNQLEKIAKSSEVKQTVRAAAETIQTNAEGGMPVLIPGHVEVEEKK